jgi:hypothetical protein
MLQELGDNIQAELEGMGMFNAVERNLNKRTVQRPPAAVHYLNEDRMVTDRPTAKRELIWEIVLLAPAMGPDKGRTSINTLIDAVRDRFTGWQPRTGNCLPCSIPAIRLVGMEDNMLIYTVTLTMRLMAGQL